jgi:hypothetical protein
MQESQGTNEFVSWRVTPDGVIIVEMFNSTESTGISSSLRRVPMLLGKPIV